MILVAVPPVFHPDRNQSRPRAGFPHGRVIVLGGRESRSKSNSNFQPDGSLFSDQILVCIKPGIGKEWGIS